MSKLPLFLAFLVASLPGAFGAVIDFESPYTLGVLATVGPAGGPAAFTGQQGWSQSTSNEGGNIIATTTSGEYTGGQGLSGNTYIGALSGAILASTYTFDLYSGAGTGERLALGPWSDLNNDGMFQHNEMGSAAGFANNPGGGVPFGFGVRSAALGVEFSSGVVPAADTWYRMTVTRDDSTFTLTLNVTNLTLGMPVDLDPVGAGTSYSVTLTSTQYGFAEAEFDGLFTRISGTFVVDNVDVAVLPVPEPGVLTLVAAGLGATILRFRRRRARS